MVDNNRQEWLNKMRKLARQIRNMTPEERERLAARMMVVTCEGHTLSLNNQCFLAMQTAAHLTMIGGFRQWIKAGRAVRKGEHAVGYIYVPMVHKADVQAGEDADPEVRFRLVPVFDVTQTDEIATAVEAIA